MREGGERRGVWAAGWGHSTHTSTLRMGADYIFPNKWLSRRVFMQLCIIDWPSPGCTPDGVGGVQMGLGCVRRVGEEEGSWGAHRLNRNQQFLAAAGPPVPKGDSFPLSSSEGPRAEVLGGCGWEVGGGERAWSSLSLDMHYS